MHCFTFLLQATLLELCATTYVLETSFTSANWFDQFTFFTGTDPTAGYVNYVNETVATKNGYINTDNNLVYMGVDYTNVVNGTGRDSVRITGNADYNYGLFSLDVAHMPGGICGTWPAFWMLGPNWPNDGEIDIIEGINDNANNAMTLHTSEGCSITDDDGAFSGTMVYSDCWINDPNQPANAGCSIENQNISSYGADFNSIGGGVIVTEWTSSAINIWWFPRGTTPSDLQAGNPNPTSWGEPVAQYEGGCNIPTYFQDLQIVFDTTFCGDWAGEQWSASSHCSSLADTCNDYVQKNPSAFTNAYWSINSLKVYQSNNQTAAAAASVSEVALNPAGHQKNHTAPLLSAPLAMGGGLPNPPPGRRRMRKGKA